MFSRFSQSLEMWQQLTGSQKMALGVALVILVLVTIVIAKTASQPQYVQLYGNLTSEDAATVVQKLQEMKVEYRLASGGNSIEVPAQRADEIRLNLAGEGLPRGGNVGFELFNKAQIGQSEFGERLNYVRALQGELARTIGELNSVRSARVHLALPERRLYSAEEQKPTASVVLDLQGPDPTPGEIKSIIHLVASAVEGLLPANVTVVDTQNKLLSEMADVDGADGASSMRLQAQQTVAKQIEQRVQSMLDKVLGPGKSIARANVKLNYDQKTIEREVYTPLENQLGVLESEHRASESYNGAKPGATGGPVGAVPNTSPTATVTGTRGSGTYSREENTTQYRVSKSIESTQVSPGQIERLTLALFIDEGIESTQLESLKKTVATAVGIDAARGDAIEVQPMKFNAPDTTTQDKVAKKQAWMSQLASIGKYAGGAVMLLIFLMVVSSLYRSTFKNEERPAMDEGMPLALPDGEFTPAALPSLSASPVGALEQYEANNEPEELAMLDTAEYDLSNVDPKHVAIVIKELMAE
ncbi:MAG: flagellar basal-body MS-ring/collar protein FliF [Armatimonadota bacterium]